MPPDSWLQPKVKRSKAVNPFLADLGHEQAEQAHQPALQRIVADDGARHGDAEQRQPEEFIGAERQRDFGQQRREGGQADHAEQRAGESARRGDADRPSRLAAQCQRVAVGA